MTTPLWWLLGTLLGVALLACAAGICIGISVTIDRVQRELLKSTKDHS